MGASSPKPEDHGPRPDPEKFIMSADPLDALEPRDNVSGKPEALPGSSTPWPGRSRGAASILAPSSESWVGPPLLPEMVRHDVSAASEPGRAWPQGSNREPMPELGTSESVSTEALRFPNRDSDGAAAAATAAQPERPFAQSAQGG